MVLTKNFTPEKITAFLELHSNVYGSTLNSTKCLLILYANTAALYSGSELFAMAHTDHSLSESLSFLVFCALSLSLSGDSGRENISVAPNSIAKLPKEIYTDYRLK